MTITINEPIDIDVQQVFKLLIEQYGKHGIERELLEYLNAEIDFEQAYMLRDMIVKHIKDNS